MAKCEDFSPGPDPVPGSPVTTDGFAVRVAPGGVRFDLHAVPGARREAVLGVHGDAIRVAVRAVAEEGRANAALLEVLSTTLGVARRSIAIVAGHGGRRKVVEVTGATAETVRTRLLAAVAARATAG